MPTFQTTDQVFTVSTKRVIPDDAVVLTGTMFTNGQSVVGSGTLFTTEIGAAWVGAVGSPSKLQINGWLYSPTNSEVRKIKEVVSDTLLILYSGFSINVAAGAQVQFVKPSRVKFLGIANALGGAIIDGATAPAGFTVNFGDNGNSPYIVDPIVIDSTANPSVVSIQSQGV